MIPRAATWDRDAFERLKLALDEALAQRDATVRLVINPPRNRWSPPGKVSTFTTAEARQKIAELAPEFAPPDQPAREYREGREGE